MNFSEPLPSDYSAIRSASRGTSLNARVQLADYLSPIFTKAGLQFPEQLQSGDMSKREQEALTQADEAYKAADKALGNVAKAVGSEDMKNAARIQRIFELYGRSHVAKLAGRPQEADQYLAGSKQAVTDLQNQDPPVPLPPLPGVLAALVVAPTTAPGGSDDGSCTGHRSSPAPPRRPNPALQHRHPLPLLHRMQRPRRRPHPTRLLRQLPHPRIPMRRQRQLPRRPRAPLPNRQTIQRNAAGSPMVTRFFSMLVGKGLAQSNARV